MSKPYWQKLQDPRWQKKRLEIMERAGFKCMDCDDSTETLSVHHSYYEKGKEPWEYHDQALHCLCAGCHEARADAERQLLLAFSRFGTSDVLTIAEGILYAANAGLAGKAIRHGIDLERSGA